MKFFIKGKRINIRNLRLSDAQDLLDSINHKDILKYVAKGIGTPTLEKEIASIKRSNAKLKKGISYNLGIELNGKIIGAVGLKNIDEDNKNAETGYWLGKKYWGNGYVSEAVNLLLSFGFKKLGLNMIYAKVLDGNNNSKKTLEKLNFEFTGRIKEMNKVNKTYKDDLIYCLLKKEYIKNRD